MENTENQISKKQIIKKMRSAISHVGFSLFAYDASAIAFSSLATAVLGAVMSFFGYGDKVMGILGTSEYMWISTVVFQFIIATGIFLILIRIKKPIAEFDKTKKKLSAKQTVIVGIVCISVMQIGAYISNILSMVVDALRGAPLESALEELITESNVFVVILIVVIIGPILEEIIFRKCIIDRFRPFGEGFAVVCSALIFAIAHGNFLQVFYSFGLGALLAILYLKTNNLNICIGYHMFVNFVGSVIPLMFLRGGVQSATENMQFTPALVAFLMYMVLLFLITAAGVLIIILTYRQIKFEKCSIEGINVSDKIKAFMFNPGMILVFLTTVYNFILSF